MSGATLQDALRAHQAGDLDKAAAMYRAILTADPRNFDALYLLGYIQLQRAQWHEAEQLLSEALQVKPASLDALYNRGRALERLERPAEALSCFDKALIFRPDIPEILFHRGNVLLALHRIRDALASYDRAVAIKPEFPEAWNNRGNALADLRRLDEALVSYERVLAARPGDAAAHNHRALTLFELKRYEEGAREFATVLALDPATPYAKGNLLYCKLNACDWTGLDADRAEIATGLHAGIPIVAPIHIAAFSASPGEQLRAARIWAAGKYPPASEPMWKGEKYRHERLRIAYLSADFHSHATAALMAGVFEAHDRSRFETFAVSFGPDDASEMRRRLVAGFGRFIDVREKTDSEIAALLRHEEIDIAIDLKGYTQDSRPGILSHRPAPIQAHYLGFPGTMGTPAIDYIIADSVVIPPEHEAYYSERVVRLPDTYQCNDSKRRIAERAPSRAEAGLPEQSFVFCCFNNNFKIQPEMFALWMRLLASVEGSVLWLIEDNAAAARNLKREAAARGIAAERLVFAPRVNLDMHLARHRLASLFLDTLPYNAHTSASDALWADLPVLTCIGTSFPGRVAASLLQAVGLPELVTESLEAYETLALTLARNPEELSTLRAKLLHNRDAYPLFDTARFTRNLESAYSRMWDRLAQGLPPASFKLA